MSTAIHVHCDAAIAEAQAPGSVTPRLRFVLAAMVLASSLDFIDGSVVNVGLAAIGRNFNANAADLQWVLNAYSLPLSALLLLGGAAGDRFGRRRLLLIGIVVFAVASAACAAAPSLWLLVLGRALQGVGAAMVMPNSLAVLGVTFSGPAKGQAIGIWAAAASIAAALGPVIGGALIDVVGWPAIFLLNLPIAAVGFVLIWRFVRDAPDEGGAPLDIIGAALVTLGLGALIWGLTLGAGPQGWSISAVAGLVVGAVLLLLFIAFERRQGDKAMVPLALFGSASFVGLTLLTLFLYGALSVLFLLVPFMLIQAAASSGTAAGAALLPFPLIMAIASPRIGKLSAHIGVRLPLTVSPIIVAVGFLLAAQSDFGGGYWTDLFPAVVVIAVGMAGAVAPLTNAVLSAVDRRHAGAASGINSAVAQTGPLVATALLGGVLAAGGATLIKNVGVSFTIAAIAALGASASAFLLIRTR